MTKRTTSPHPEWATKYRRPGTELRKVNDHLYHLSECRSVYDKEKKRARKISGKYLGSITEEGGFKESKARQREREIEELKAAKGNPEPVECRVGEVKEFGLSKFILENQTDTLDELKRLFPMEWTRIAALAYCRLRHQSPLRRVSSDFADSFMSVRIGDKGLSANSLSGFMHDLGTRRDTMLEYMRSKVDPDNGLIFDGTDLLSASRLMDYPQMSKTKRGGFDTEINLMWVYNTTLRLPVYYRILPGSVKDVSSFRLSLEDAGLKDGIAIIDKGFQSKTNIGRLDELGIKFVMSLKRSTPELDYSCFANRDNSDADGFFLYQKRPIWWKQLTVENHTVFIYLDEAHRADEAEDYLRRVTDPDKEEYTIEEYRKKSLRFGTLALMTTTGENAEDNYLTYKTRGDVEQAIDAFKNILDADHSCMQDEKSLEAWMFINLIALQWYYDLRHRIHQAKMQSKYAPMDIVRALSRCRAVKVDANWQAAEVMKKDRLLLDATGLHITPNIGIL